MLLQSINFGCITGIKLHIFAQNDQFFDLTVKFFDQWKLMLKYCSSLFPLSWVSFSLNGFSADGREWSSETEWIRSLAYLAV